MDTRTRVGTRIRRIQDNLRLTRPIALLATGVLFPVVLSTSVGIVALAMGKSSKDLVLGVLVICFTAAAMGAAVIVVILLGRRARTARLQSDLLGNVSHELKTPLAAIRLHAQTIQTGVDAPTAAKCVETIVRETAWLETMVDRLLTWRTASRDRDHLHFQSSTLTAAVEHAARRFRAMIHGDEVAFVVTIDTQAPVMHDRNGISSLLVNLLTNAYKYSGKDKQVTLSAKDEDGWVVVRVADNGFGIAPADQARIFEPFFRSPDPRNIGKAGAGIGLAIVSFMVQAHNGFVQVKSDSGQGTQFTVRLPVDKASGAGQ